MRMPWNFRNSAKEAVKTKGSSDDEQTDSGPRAAGHSQVGPSAKTEIKETISRSYGNEENATTQNAAKKVRGLSGALAKLVRIPRQIQQASFAQFKARRPEPVTAAQKACVASPQAAIPPKFGKSSLVAVHSWLQQADVTPEAITPLNFGDLIAPDYKPGPRNASPDFLYSRRASDSANLFGFTQWEKGGATASSGSMSSSSSTESLTNGWKEPARSTENRPVTFLDPELVGNNGSNIPCVAHSAVSVEIQGVRHYVHANRIHTQDSNPAIGEHVEKGVYVAGQSPSKVDALRLLLTHAIDSRQGIFQIIKSDDHAATMAGKSSKSLLAKLSRIRAGEILGERYEVESLERAYQDDVHACYLLRVRSTTGTSEAITIPLTQVGLNFDEKLLRTREINDAHRFLE